LTRPVKEIIKEESKEEEEEKFEDYQKPNESVDEADVFDI